MGWGFETSDPPFPWLCISYSKVTPSKPIQTASPNKDYVLNICAYVGRDIFISTTTSVYIQIERYHNSCCIYGNSGMWEVPRSVSYNVR